MLRTAGLLTVFIASSQMQLHLWPNSLKKAKFFINIEPTKKPQYSSTSLILVNAHL